MSSVVKFIRANSTFDPDTLCASFCGCQPSPTCDEMANRIFAAAMNGERDPDKLWQIAARGLDPAPSKGAPT
jgi:hypothetical protein